MKKHIYITLVVAILCLSQILFAIPAKRGVVQLTQPDGSKVSVIIHGDEWFHYVTDMNGNIMEENASGFMVKSNATMADIHEKMTMAHRVRNDIFTLQQQAPARAVASGSPKIPVCSGAVQR